MKIPKAIQDLAESFQRLPGVGPKSAQRLTFYLLHVPQIQLDKFSESLLNLKKNIIICKQCFNIGEEEICSVCSDPYRDKSTLCVVEDAMDVIAIEKSGKYKGHYHVLHGLIDPLNSLGPDDIYIPQLLERVRKSASADASVRQGEIKEIIIATNPTMEGEATAMYLSRELKTSREGWIKVTRIGHGLPVGADIEYADDITLSRALEGRREY